MDYLYFEPASIPTEISTQFETQGCATLWKTESEFPVSIWDIDLYLLLSNPNKTEGLTYRYYPNFDIRKKNKPASFPDHLSESAFKAFHKGYSLTFKNDFYIKRLKEEIWPLSMSDENIKKYSIKLHQDILQFDLKLISFDIVPRNDFQKLGEVNGFFTLLTRILTQHGWQMARPKATLIKKKGLSKIPTEKVSSLESKLRNDGLIDNNGVIRGAGPVISALLNVLSTNYGATRADIHKQLEPILKKKDKYLKTSEEKEARQMHEKQADAIFSSVFR